MNRLVSENLAKELAKIVRGKRYSAAIAYVTSEAHLKFRRDDTLITDASDKAIECGMTSAKVLSAACKRGAHVFSLKNLHAKMLVCGRTAIIGSANLSASSANNLIEAAAITDDPTIVAQASAFVDKLSGLGVTVDDKFLSRILKIKVKRQGWTPGRGRTVSVKASGGSTWIVGVRELADGAYPDEQSRVDAGEKKANARRSSTRNDVSWIRYTGKDHFGKFAAEGDSIVQIWRSLRGKRATVFQHSPILYRQNETKCVRFYIEDYPDAAKTAIALGRFRRIAFQAGITRQVGPASAREISQDESSTIKNLWPKKSK